MVNKITSPITPLGEIDKINEVIDEVDKKLDKSGGNMTGNLSVNGVASITTNGYVVGTWLQTKSASVNNNLTTVAMLDGNGWIYKQSKDTLLSGTENTSNKVTSLSSSSTDVQYPSAKCVYDALQNAGGGGATRNIGEIVASTIPLTDAGLHLLDGALISGSGVYSAFVTYIAGLRTQYSNLFTTESAWQTAVSTYGVCGKFVYDSTNNTVRLPKYSNKIYTKGINSTAPVVGNGLSLGLSASGTNSGNFGIVKINSTDNHLYAATGGYGKTINSSSTTSGAGTVVQNGAIFGVTTDPEKSGLIAQLSDITTSLDGYYYIVIATSTKTDIQVDIDEIATDLNGKADRDGSNMVSSVKNFDGQWVASTSTLSTATAIGTYTIDLSSYLPNDNYNYEVYLYCKMECKATSATVFSINGQRVLIADSYGTSNSMQHNSNSIIIVGSSRSIEFIIANQKPTSSEITAYMYRRIGTNN